MKKFLLNLAFFGVVILISLFGIAVAMTLEYYSINYPSFFVGNKILCVAIILLSICTSFALHELAHIVGYKIRKHDMRLIYIFPFCFVRENNHLNIKFALNMILGIGGFTVPKLNKIKSRQQLKDTIEAMRFSLIIAPTWSLIYGLMTFLLLLNTSRLPLNIQSYIFTFAFTNVLVSIYIVFVSSINFAGIVGDISAYFRFKKEKLFALNQMYNEILMQENDVKDYIRNNKIVFNEFKSILKEFVEYTPSIYSAIDTIIYEHILLKNTNADECIDEFVKKLMEENFVSISPNLKFELYSRLFCHIIIYIYLYIDFTKAEKFWLLFEKELSKSTQFKYYRSQCEKLIYGSEIVGSPINSSIDSILKNMSNFYTDEVILNDLISEKSAKTS